MSSATSVRCDVCGAECPWDKPQFYVTTKRAAPSLDVDVCTVTCLGELAARLRQQASNEVTKESA